MQKTFFLLLLVVGFQVSAQNLSSKNKKAIELYVEADNYRVRGQFTQAINLLQEALTRDKNFEEAYYRLATIYKVQEKYELAQQTLEKGYDLVKPDSRKRMYLYELAAVNLWQGKYELCKKYTAEFLLIEKEDYKKIALAKVWQTQAEYALQNPTVYDYSITPLSDSVNIFPMQYFPTVTADGMQLIFTARYGGNRNDNEDLVVSNKRTNGEWGEPVSLSANINTIQREGASTISADGRHLIFTVCGASGCDLYESRKTGSNWSKPKNMGPNINSARWDAQPSLSADGRELYFVSERAGGLGGYDIWYSQLTDKGWSKAINAGPAINTPHDEISPYIHVNNRELYFVSNGLPGYGGYDIYKAQKTETGWDKPLNMGKPLNDHHDQYSFIVSALGDQGYYSREESKNRSRLYRIVLPQQLVTTFIGNVVSGTITHATTQQPIRAQIELYNLAEKKSVSKVFSDSVTGQYLIVLPGGAEYALYVEKPGFLFNSEYFNYKSGSQQAVKKDIALTPVYQNAAIVLNNIFFDTDKYDLRAESILELEKVVDFLRSNTTIKIEIAGHTDNSGSEVYNLKLSENRAKSVADFLLSNNIPQSQIQIRGYGSKIPRVANTTDHNRQQNRRIEFKIIGFSKQ
ncbi:MAG: OmpA family protein [Cyclobacteriaceae bacterium]|nr:OmpA family protein [Cyclobacteriaceae bacterium]